MGELESDDDEKAKKKEYTVHTTHNTMFWPRFACWMTKKRRKTIGIGLRQSGKKHFYRFLRILLLFIRARYTYFRNDRRHVLYKYIWSSLSIFYFKMALRRFICNAEYTVFGRANSGGSEEKKCVGNSINPIQDAAVVSFICGVRLMLIEANLCAITPSDVW